MKGGIYRESGAWDDAVFRFFGSARPIRRMFSSKIPFAALCAGTLLFLPALSGARPAGVRADAPLVGVPGRTSGSETFLRVRPSALTPPVAKVPSGTKVYVWGKYQDWYRVETKDHLFGWVHKKYIDARHLRKVREISHFKAKEASDKSSRQTLFGTPAELKIYYARYGGAGAVKGLALKGVYLAAKNNPAPVRLAKFPARKAGRKAAVRVAVVPKPHVKAKTRVAAATIYSGGTLLPPPTQQELGVNRNVGDDLRATPDALAPDASSLANRVHGWTPASSVPAKQTAPVSPPPRLATVAPSPPVIQAPRVAVNSGETTTPLEPVLPKSNVLMAPAKVASTPSLSAGQKHILAWQARKRAKEQRWKWLQAKKANDWKYRVAHAQKRAVAAANRRQYLAKLRASQHIRLAARKGDQRRNLGASIGLAPKQLPPNVSLAPMPVSPDEILKGRDQWLKTHPNETAPVVNSQTAPTASGTPLTPSGLSSPAPTGVLPRKLDALLFGSDQQKSQTAQELSASSASSESSTGQGASSADAPSSSMPVPLAVPFVPAPKTSIAAPSRGGSPRDRAARSWSSGVASQALSYRGMPYRFGAASPRAGFDCSGLIFYILRQRGLKPPRTAAGYRTYGHPVARGQWQTGDLILFANTYKRGISHIGVYLKDGKFVHAASTRQGVRVDSLMTGYFAKKYWGARRIK